MKILSTVSDLTKISKQNQNKKNTNLRFENIFPHRNNQIFHAMMYNYDIWKCIYTNNNLY